SSVPGDLRVGRIRDLLRNCRRGYVRADLTLNPVPEVRTMTMRRMLSSFGLLTLAVSVEAACAGTSSLQPKAITAPTVAPPPAVTPFAGARFYGDPEFVRTVGRVQAPTPEDAARLKKMAGFPTAVWLESVETAKLAAATLDDAQKLSAAGGGPVVPVFVI